MSRITIQLLQGQIEEVFSSPFYHILLWLIVLDIASGYIKAFKTKSFDSKISTNGWLKHAFVMALITVVGVYSRALDYAFVSKFICCGFIGSYGLSLLENLDAIGVPYPQGFREFFRQMRDHDAVKFTDNGGIRIDVSNDDEIKIDKD